MSLRFVLNDVNKSTVTHPYITNSLEKLFYYQFVITGEQMKFSVLNFKTKLMPTLFLLKLFFLVACSQQSKSINTENLVRSGDGKSEAVIGDNNQSYKIITGEKYLNEKIVIKNSLRETSLSLPADKIFSGAPLAEKLTKDVSLSTLLLGYPVDLLGQQIVFGGVITAVSDDKDEALGGLKLSDLTPVHGVLKIDPKNNLLNLLACEMKCNESSALQSVLQIPMVGADPEKKYVYLNLTSLGEQLNILQKMDPNGSETGLSPVSSKLALVDFSLNTLVFDVESLFERKNLKNDGPNKQVSITARWYIKLSSQFNPAFESRDQIESVGFFTTQRSEKTKISRFSLTNFGNQNAVVKYYIKDVPVRYQKAFSDSFEAWNNKLKSTLGRDLFEYEFIAQDDSRYELLVAGDIRYNILEWDLKNRAGYGGLGPSIANQFSGQTMNATVLIQGPTIEELYKNWFQVKYIAEQKIADGDITGAENIKAEFQRNFLRKFERNKTKSQIHLGKNLKLVIHSEDPRKHDPIALRMDFEDIPTGYDYDQYMYGYFIDMVAHELGHNIGLRHNFRGNLGSNDSNQIGSVSRSVMEYLGRAFRYLDTVGDYDVMAIAYGYKGILPKHSDWFCTDEDSTEPGNSQASAECSSSDATSDPYSYFERQLAKVIRLLTNPGDAKKPSWEFSDLKSSTETFATGLISYAASAIFTADTWTNFFQDNDRPLDPMKIPNYVLSRLSDQICSDDFAKYITEKENQEAQDLTKNNIEQLQKTVRDVLDLYKEPVPLLNMSIFPCLK